MNFSEADISKWLWGDGEAGATPLWSVLSDAGYDLRLNATAYRELPIGDGRADFVIVGEATITVVELKIGVADSQALGQVMAYMSDLEHEAVLRGGTTYAQGIIMAPEFDPRLVKACSCSGSPVGLARIIPWFLGSPGPEPNRLSKPSDRLTDIVERSYLIHPRPVVRPGPPAPAARPAPLPAHSPDVDQPPSGSDGVTAPMAPPQEQP